MTASLGVGGSRLAETTFPEIQPIAFSSSSFCWDATSPFAAADDDDGSVTRRRNGPEEGRRKRTFVPTDASPSLLECFLDEIVEG